MADCFVDVLLPSRGRPGLLGRSVASLASTASGRGVRIVVGADDDDHPTILDAAALGARIKVLPRQGYERLHEYYRRLAEGSTADWLLVWNDDAMMLTPGWDEILAGLPDEVMVADLQSNHSPTCCFPAVRREAVDAIGTFCSGNPHVDSFWEVVGRDSGTLRAVPISVRHAQQPHAHSGNEHGFHDPAHRAELARYAAILSRKEDRT